MNIENVTKYIDDFPHNFFSTFGINIKKFSKNNSTSDTLNTEQKSFNNFTDAQIKELFSSDFSSLDNLKVFIGLTPNDQDKDGVPDAYEAKHKMNPNNPDTDSDGIYDGEEVYKGLDPVNADHGQDGVLDGRDAYPLDGSRSVLENDIDTDGDGVGDRFETYISSNKYVKDTDGDGLSDAVDDNVKINYRDSVKLKSQTLLSANKDELNFSIQNNFLDFVGSVVLIFSIVILPIFVFIFVKWWNQINNDIDHYYHLFHNAFGFKHHDTGHTHNNTVHNENFKDIKKEIKYENGNDPINQIDNNVNGSIKSENNNPLTSTGIFEPTAKELVFEIDTRWKIVTKYMNDEASDLWRLGIIESDNILDEALKNIGYVGNNLGERLQSANFRTIDFAWDAHKIRNRIAHEGLTFNLTDREARKAFVLYETVLKDLKVI